MTRHIVSDMQWSAQELDALPKEHGFRMRGLETTRLDTLIDAGFAFALSFLAIAQDDLPSSLAELVGGLKAVPALILSFLVLMVFWLDHRRWSRRYGIETKLSVLLSVSLVFGLLIYIFPLRMLFESMFDFLTNGYLPFDFELNTEADARQFFVLYASGFLMMTLLVAGHYWVAVRKRLDLGLNRFELLETQFALAGWLIASGFAVLSITLASTLPIRQIHWAGFVFCGLAVTQVIQQIMLRAQKARL